MHTFLSITWLILWNYRLDISWYGDLYIVYVMAKASARSVNLISYLILTRSDINEGLVLLKLADKVLILINTGSSNVKGFFT